MVPGCAAMSAALAVLDSSPTDELAHLLPKPVRGLSTAARAPLLDVVRAVLCLAAIGTFAVLGYVSMRAYFSNTGFRWVGMATPGVKRQGTVVVRDGNVLTFGVAFPQDIEFTGMGTGSGQRQWDFTFLLFTTEGLPPMTRELTPDCGRAGPIRQIGTAPIGTTRLGLGCYGLVVQRQSRRSSADAIGDIVRERLVRQGLVSSASGQDLAAGSLEINYALNPDQSRGRAISPASTDKAIEFGRRLENVSILTVAGRRHTLKFSDPVLVWLAATGQPDARIRLSREDKVIVKADDSRKSSDLGTNPGVALPDQTFQTLEPGEYVAELLGTSGASYALNILSDLSVSSDSLLFSREGRRLEAIKFIASVPYTATFVTTTFARVQATLLSSGRDVVLELYNKTGRLIDRADDPEAIRQFIAPGEYELRVSGYSALDRAGGRLSLPIRAQLRVSVEPTQQ
jgi:hypothetical protein